MNFKIKPPTPRTDANLVPNTDVPYVHAYFARILERELSMPNLPTCRNCGAEYEEKSTKEQGKYICPLCGHENYWKRISRFVMI